VQDDEWVPLPLTITNKRNIKWAQKPFNQPSLNLDVLEPSYTIIELKSPSQYFAEYFDNNVFEKLLPHEVCLFLMCNKNSF